MNRYPKPVVCKIGTHWMASVIRGFSGNYETDLQSFTSWRDAFNWAHSQVKDWDPSLRHSGDKVRYQR